MLQYKAAAFIILSCCFALSNFSRVVVEGLNMENEYVIILLNVTDYEACICKMQEIVNTIAFNTIYRTYKGSF